MIERALSTCVSAHAMPSWHPTTARMVGPLSACAAIECATVAPFTASRAVRQQLLDLSGKAEHLLTNRTVAAEALRPGEASQGCRDTECICAAEEWRPALANRLRVVFLIARGRHAHKAFEHGLAVCL
eukprot:CAMPEP_0115842906 /NCGR_PEP_ID=MMETSP0287-20121206/8040_1 /TAXON_ID=412157 /ORGANISM="Chrysochromulina rotalis, Strain UIO044" /LENGTH=127 /DNA_ID=CAMNT_0003296587 /DNA_START=399 /DNA_END=780 /DNA_ORIENTATION=-